MRNKYYDAYRIFNYHVKVKNKNNNDYKKISSIKKKVYSRERHNSAYL